MPERLEMRRPLRRRLRWQAAVRAGVVMAVTVGALVRVASAQDWPAFRGPAGEGHSSERGVPSSWSETQNIAWKTPVPGKGWSSPVVAGGQVWITTATTDGRASVLRALAYDVESGREVVNAELFRLDRPTSGQHPKNTLASPTPIVSGDRVYTHFGPEGTAALTTKGEVLWKTRLEYQPQHGAGGSPVLHGDLLILNCDGNDVAFVTALDARTGKVRWKTPRRGRAGQAYTTPLVLRVGERDQLVSVGAFRTVAYDPQSGKEIWSVDYGDGFSNVPRPVASNGLVYITTGFFQPQLLAIRPDGTGDVTSTHVAWSYRRNVPLTPSPLIVGQELYMVNDAGLATCLDAKTGDVRWQQRFDGQYAASPVYADGRIYFLSEQGVATVIAPGTEFKRLASNALEGSTLASIAVARSSLFIRTDTHLYRVASSARPSAND